MSISIRIGGIGLGRRRNSALIVLDAPSDLAATYVSDSQIDLTWTNNETDTYTGNKVYLSTDSINYTLKDTIAAIGTTHSVTGLTANTHYFFKIVAYGTNALSGYSNIVLCDTTQVLLSDTFTDADSTALSAHVMDVGTGWTHQNNWQVQSNKAVVTTSGATSLARANATESDIVLTLDYTMPAELNYSAGVIFRVNNYATPTMWRLMVARAGGAATCTLTLTEFAPGATSRGTATVTHENATTRQLKITCNASAIAVFWNSVSKITYSSSLWFDKNEHGLAQYRDANYKQVSLDNFLVKSVRAVKSIIGSFENSITYAVGVRNAYSKYKFYYSGTTIQIRVNTTIYAVYPDWAAFDIYINGTFNQTVQFVNNSFVTVTLPAGTNKVVTLIESYLSYSGGMFYGTWMTDLIFDSTFIKITEADTTDKLVLCGDSIMHGAFATVPSINGPHGLFYAAGKNVGMYSYSSGYLEQLASDAGKIAVTVADIQTLFAHATTTKSLVIELGTNDATAGTAHLTFKGWYGNLLDAIHAADSGIHVYCLSPIHREDAKEASHLVAYRADILNLCSTRDYTTYIDGAPICTYPGDYYDTIHPDDSGYVKIYNALNAVIYP